MVVAFLNRLNHIFISGMLNPCFSYQRLKLPWMHDILFNNDIYIDQLFEISIKNQYHTSQST